LLTGRSEETNRSDFLQEKRDLTNKGGRIEESQSCLKSPPFGSISVSKGKSRRSERAIGVRRNQGSSVKNRLGKLVIMRRG